MMMRMGPELASSLAIYHFAMAFGVLRHLWSRQCVRL